MIDQQLQALQQLIDQAVGLGLFKSAGMVATAQNALNETVRHIRQLQQEISMLNEKMVPFPLQISALHDEIITLKLKLQEREQVIEQNT